MRSFCVGPWCFVVYWYGLSGSLDRHRWGVVGRYWPTVYAGPFKIVSGPRPEATDAEG